MRKISLIFLAAFLVLTSCRVLFADDTQTPRTESTSTAQNSPKEEAPKKVEPVKLVTAIEIKQGN